MTQPTDYSYLEAIVDTQATGLRVREREGYIAPTIPEPTIDPLIISAETVQEILQSYEE